MFSKIKTMLNKEKEIPNKGFRIDLLTPEQREELEEQARINKACKENQEEQKKLDQAFQWALSANPDDIDDPEEREIVEKIQQEERERIKEGAKSHADIHSRTVM